VRPDGVPEPAGRPSYARSVDVGWSSLLPIAALLVGTVVAYEAGRAVNDTAVHVLLAVVGALALDRVVRAVERLTRLSRAAAVTVVVTLTAGLVGGVLALLVPAVLEQSRRVGDDAPAVLDDLVHLPVIGRALQENDVPAQAQRWLDTFPDRFAGDADGLVAAMQAAGVQAAAVVQTLLLLFLLLAEGPALVDAVHRFLPSRWVPTTDRVARSAYVVVGRYAVGSVLLALLAGTAAFCIGLALGVPLAAAAAVWVFLWNFVPQLGGIVGGAGLVALALTTGLGPALTAAVVWLVYTQLENRVVQPVVVGRAVSLSPLTTMVVALVGVAAAGLLGAVLAIPLVAAVNAARLELRTPP
jgi:predicted PurR-regulated permease PerM